MLAHQIPDYVIDFGNFCWSTQFNKQVKQNKAKQRVDKHINNVSYNSYPL